jgi:fatty-acyl-CoA synthase
MQAPIDVEATRTALEARHPAWVPRTLHGALDAATDEHPGRPFVLADEGTATYAQLAAWSARIAAGLLEEGLGDGDRVALLLPNSPAMIAALFAISRAGGVAVPLHVRLQPRELEYVLRQSGATVLLTVEAFRDAAIGAALDELAPGWAAGGGGARLPALRRVVLCPGGDLPPRAGAMTLADLEREPGPAVAERAQAVEPAAAATIFYTSGTTGRPKGVVLTHDMELRSAYGSAYTRAFEDARRILFALPLHHVFAYVEGLLAALWVGGAVIPQASFDPEATLAAIERHRADEALFVPTMTLAVIDAAAATAHDLSSLHAVMSAAATCPARLWQQVAELLDVTELVTGYGMTETAAATTFTMPHDPIELMVETVGRPKLGGVAAPPGSGGVLAAYRTVDPATGAELPDGAVGELVAEGPIVTTRYHDDPEQTAAAFDARGRLRSGDLGRVRSDGYLALTGRSKELYKCGGEQVMPQEVEATLTERPDVAQAHVVALPDERMGEVGCAWVVPADGHEPSAEALIAHCRAQLSRFKVPARVLFCSASELPLTPSGKVQKFVLADRAAALAETAAR